MPITSAQALENGRKGGRPQSTPTKMSRKKGDELAASNRSPLDVMMDNMWFWWDKSKEMGVQLENMLINNDEDGQPSAEDVKEARALARSFLAARENAQKCAVDAAPYIHPKFQSIDFRGKMHHTAEAANGKPKEITAETSAAEAADMFANALREDMELS